MPKIFFEDTGLANVLMHRALLDKPNGALIENAIYSELRSNFQRESIFYWRTAQKQEIDFILTNVFQNKNNLLAIEVKQSFFNKDTSNLRYFKNKYPESNLYVSTIFERKKINIMILMF